MNINDVAKEAITKNQLMYRAEQEFSGAIYPTKSDRGIIVIEKLSKITPKWSPTFEDLISDTWACRPPLYDEEDAVVNGTIKFTKPTPNMLGETIQKAANDMVEIGELMLKEGLATESTGMVIAGMSFKEQARQFIRATNSFISQARRIKPGD